MKILAISGSARTGSTNTSLLNALRDHAPSGMQVTVFDRIAALPVFSPDLEGPNTPASIRDFQAAIADADALIIASPEYVHSIPGGLKNAIDWLVSGDQIIDKPIVLAHASHRGDDMLTALRRVLGTVSARFDADVFLRFCLLAKSEHEIRGILAQTQSRSQIAAFFAQIARLHPAR